MTTRALKRLNSSSAPKTYKDLNDQKLAILKFLDDHTDKASLICHGIVR